MGQKKHFSLFKAAASSMGYDLRVATPKERLDDIDFVLWDPSSPSNPFPVSIKSTLVKKTKKRKRLWAWIELRNRRGGDGWLYQKCPFVAYERKNDFVILLKKDLRSWIEASNLPRWDLPFVDSSWKAACRLFSRPNTKEAIFHLKLSDAIKNCKHQIWPKDEGSS